MNWSKKPNASPWATLKHGPASGRNIDHHMTITLKAPVEGAFFLDGTAPSLLYNPLIFQECTLFHKEHAR
jgi:hypothetical protein